MLKLRRGTVVEAGDEGDAMQRLEVDVAGERRPALAEVALIGPARTGDDIVVNVQARDLRLGSGGFDVVHVNLSRGLHGDGAPEAHVMKLNYTSLQHAVEPVEGQERRRRRVLARPVAVLGLHGQLAPVAWACHDVAAKARVGFVQTAGGALPGALSDVVRQLRARELLVGHITAGAAYGGEAEAVTTAGALEHGLGQLGWDVAICGPGPGIIGSSSALGHGGMAALDSAHAALGLGCPTVVVARMSEADERPRHRGVSHHTRTVLELLLGKVTVVLPEGRSETVDGSHELRRAAADLEGYRASGLPARTMGRTLGEDPLFFAAALAAGRVLGEMVLAR